MPTYEELKNNARKFVTLTSLTPEEFDFLLSAFERAYLKAYPVSRTMTGKKRKRKAGGGRKGTLASMEQKLLFALVYQKSYPVQSIMGELFGMGQSQANEWIHNLLPILKQALDDLGYEPERDPKKFKKSEQDQKDAIDSIIDGTERRRQRPTEAKKQVLHYSGKKVADTEEISYPEHIALHKDTGFQGYKPKVRKTYQPKKASQERPDRKRERKQSQDFQSSR